MHNQASDIRVVSETEAINGLLLAYLLNNPERKETLRKLELILNAYQQTVHQEKYLIIKMTSWNIFMADLFQELYPSVKWFYIDRNTTEVVSSLQKSRGEM